MPGASTINGTVIAQLKGNVSGVVQVLPTVTVNGGRDRSFIETLTLAAQASGSRIAVARLPLYAAIVGIKIVSSGAPGAGTVSFGDFNNDTRYSAAVALPAVETEATYVASGTYGVPITTGYDSDTGDTTKGYADIIMVTGGAALAASGTMRIRTIYTLD